MEISTVVYFYSKRNIKSLKLYKLINQLNVEIQTVNVDSSDIRERLLSDTKYKIKVVPSLLTVYDTGEFVVYTGEDLDAWIKQLVENVTSVQNMNQQEAVIESTEITSEDSSPYSGGLFLGAPGAPPRNLELSSIPATSMVKEVKKSTVSAADMAAEMMKQKEKYDEVLDSNKPFI
jgi:hypothetical protein